MNRVQIFAEIAALATTVTLLSGCSGKSSIVSTENTGSEQSATSTENKDCEHLIVNFGNQTVIFRECEGYKLDLQGNYGSIVYKIISDGDILISGDTSEYNDYVTNHEQAEEIEQEAIENGAYVFKLLK